MSKKLIAVAAAAALALTGLVAVPANATSITNVTITHGGNDTGEVMTASHADADSAVAANTFAVARDVVFATSFTSATTRTAVRFEALTAAAGAVSVESTGGVKIATSLTSGTSAIKVTAGSQTLTGATVTGALTYTFYAWNTSTTAGSVVIKSAGSTLTFYVKGLAGEAYNLTNITWPASLYKGQTDGKITFDITDAYGNHVPSAEGFASGGILGGTLGSDSYSAVTKLYTQPVDTVTGDSVALTLALANTDLSAAGFAKPVKTAFKLVSAGDLAAQIVTLTAQVAALQAQVAEMRTKADSVTKKRWNRLVRAHRALGGSAKLK